MAAANLLKNKKILIVDDEPDVLEVLGELLPMCDVTKASSFEDAKTLLRSRTFDIAILDIMGVDGYGLLDITINKKIPALMLTAHAFTPDNLEMSIRRGAVHYVPKEEIRNIREILTDVLESIEAGEDPWVPWQERFPPSYFEVRWGPVFWDTIKEFPKLFRRQRKKNTKSSDSEPG